MGRHSLMLGSTAAPSSRPRLSPFRAHRERRVSLAAHGLVTVRVSGVGKRYPDHILVVAVWGAVKGAGPDLADLAPKT